MGVLILCAAPMCTERFEEPLPRKTAVYPVYCEKHRTPDPIDHCCGGFRCDNPATIEVMAGRHGRTLGWLCEDCAEDHERGFAHNATANRLRLEREMNAKEAPQ